MIRRLIAAAFLLTSCALAQTVSSVSFQIGAGDVPTGAVSASVAIWDDDGYSSPDDSLATGLSIGSFDANHNWDSGDLSQVKVGDQYALYNNNGEVSGGNGGSGEKEAEVYIVITWKNADGAVIGTKTTSTKTVKVLTA